MGKPRTRTTVLDEVQIEAKLDVRIDRHPVDWNTLAEDVAERISAALRRGDSGCRYFNPAVTVTCLQPTPEFFRIVRKERARWCRRAGNTIPRSVQRGSSRWISGGEWISNKYARYLDRALSFTGILFIEGQPVLRHDWPR